MAVSDFNIYYQRKYRKNGLTVIEDDLHTISQVYNYSSNVNEYGIYQSYLFNNYMYLVPFYFRRWIFGNDFLAYLPGQIYIDEWYYTYKDIATLSYYQHLIEFCCGKASHSLWDIMQSNYSISNSVIYYSGYFVDPGIIGISKDIDIFWINDDGDKYILLPQIEARMTQQVSGFIKKISLQVAMDLCWFDNSVNVDTLEFVSKISGNRCYNTIYAEVNGVRQEIDTNLMAVGLSAQNLFSINLASGYSTRSQIEVALNNWFDEFKKLKFYPCSHSNTNFFSQYVYDNINYGKVNSFITNTNWNYLHFLIDVSDCTFSPTSGFVDSGGRSYLGFLKMIDDEGGPDANNPNHREDPNDKDPGHGPGGTSGDKGGNGDHDNTSDKIILPGIPTLSGSGVGLFTIFNPSASQLTQLGQKLWNPTALNAIKQYFSNPMDTILGLAIIPVEPNTGASRNIMLGIYDTEISCTTVSSDYVIKDCGSIAINRYYGSYLDYDPYTRIWLYLPYIGEIEINPDEVMQSVLGVSYYVNVVTGDIVAMLTADGSLIYTVAGNCIRQLPIGQQDYSSIINTAVSSVTTIASAVAGGSAAQSVGGAVAGAAKSEAGRQVAQARTSSQLVQESVGAGSSLIGQVMQTKMRYNHAGTLGTGSGQLSTQRPYLTIERPNLDLADNYKSFVGYPCNETLQLSHCSGFTQIESCRLSVPGATDGEMSEILQFLTEGVII